jgi:hypothetical protein
MAYLWTDKVTDYYYSNPESDTVAVLWTDPEDKLTREHYIKVDEDLMSSGEILLQKFLMKKLIDVLMFDTKIFVKSFVRHFVIMLRGKM